jgi:uncharacterized RDD family membrane protein YckC
MSTDPLDKYDTFIGRFFAGLLDGLVLLPVGLLASFMTGDKFSLIIGAVISYTAYYVYSIYFHWQSGQTLGKKWMGIRVVDKNETRLLTLEQAFMRDSVYVLISTIGLFLALFQIITSRYNFLSSMVDQVLDWFGLVWFFLEVITMMTNDKRRALHDQLAGSVVIKEEYWKQESHEETGNQ